jgi:tetratricopeptide (TPR) repeat protein
VVDSLAAALCEYDQGAYEAVRRRIRRLEQIANLSRTRLPSNANRYLAWVMAQRGDEAAVQMLNSIYPGDSSATLCAVTDYCCVLRFLDMPPDLARMQPWIDRGESYLASRPQEACSSSAFLFREHVAFAWLRNGQPEPARRLLEPALERIEGIEPHVRARVLCCLGEAHRMLGERERAIELLERARAIQVQRGLLGYLADYTYASLAKCESGRERALAWLKMAQEIQTRTDNRVGLAVSLLLEARRCGDPQRAAAIRTTVIELRPQFPVWQRSRTLATILDRWSDWTTGGEPGCDEYWGL